MNNNLVEDNMNLVYFLIRTYYPTFIQDEDIIQCGMLGLCKAATTWEEDKSTFSSYASYCILNEVRNEFKRRKKHSSQLSLDYETQDNEGEVSTLSDIIPGEVDVEYVDLDGFYKELTPRQKRVFELKQLGLTHTIIGQNLGCSHEIINREVRKMRKIWRKTNGD